ncbi:rhomboid family intramembrane serine protease [bacterium]|nr:MAG: rhomboid family intramembrane serine protease [bacterium]
MRYYTRNQSSYQFIGGDYPAVKMLLILNFIAYLLQWLLSITGGENFVYNYLALSPRIWEGQIWQLVTYMFLHADVWHMLFNMLALWLFGKELEMTWGSNEFLKYYFICGIGAGLTFLLFSKGVVIGASGAVFGLLLAFGMTFPDQIILMSLIFPIKAKYMVIIYGVITFMNIANPSGDGVAHFAHLGGMVFGLIYLKKEWFVFKANRTKMEIKPRRSESKELRPLPPREDRSEAMRSKVDSILDKINEVGYDHLTKEEKEILLEASQHLSNSDRPNIKH